MCLEKVFNADAPKWVVATDTDAHWGSYVSEKSEGVFRRPLTSGVTVPIQSLPFPVQSWVGGVALHDGHFYWSLTGKEKYVNGAVYRVQTPGSAQATREVVADFQAYPGPIVAGSDTVFWANAGSGTVEYARSNPLNYVGSFAVGFGVPVDLAITSKYLLVLDQRTNNGDGELVRVRLTGGSGPELRVTLASKINGGTSVAATEDHVYWSSFGELWEVAMSGGEAHRVWADSTSGNRIQRLATDGTSLYFTEVIGQDSGAVYRLAVGTSDVKLLAQAPELSLVEGFTIHGDSLLVAVRQWPTAGGLFRVTPR